MKNRSLLFAVVIGNAGVCGFAQTASAADVTGSHMATPNNAQQLEPFNFDAVTLHAATVADQALTHVAPATVYRVTSPIAGAFENLVYQLNPALRVAFKQVAQQQRSRSVLARYRNSLSVAVDAVDI